MKRARGSPERAEMRPSGAPAAALGGRLPAEHNGAESSTHLLSRPVNVSLRNRVSVGRAFPDNAGKHAVERKTQELFMQSSRA